MITVIDIFESNPVFIDTEKLAKRNSKTKELRFDILAAMIKNKQPILYALDSERKDKEKGVLTPKSKFSTPEEMLKTIFRTESGKEIKGAQILNSDELTGKTSSGDSETTEQSELFYLELIKAAAGKGKALDKIKDEFSSLSDAYLSQAEALIEKLEKSGVFDNVNTFELAKNSVLSNIFKIISKAKGFRNTNEYNPADAYVYDKAVIAELNSILMNASILQSAIPEFENKCIELAKEKKLICLSFKKIIDGNNAKIKSVNVDSVQTFNALSFAFVFNIGKTLEETNKRADLYIETPEGKIQFEITTKHGGDKANIEFEAKNKTSAGKLGKITAMLKNWLLSNSKNISYLTAKGAAKMSENDIETYCNLLSTKTIKGFSKDDFFAIMKESDEKFNDVKSAKKQCLYFIYLFYTLSKDKQEEMLNTMLSMAHKATGSPFFVLSENNNVLVTEGGNVSVKLGAEVHSADRIDLHKISREEITQEISKMFNALNTLYEKKYSIALWKNKEYLNSNMVFNGSSNAFFDKAINDEEFKKYKPLVGDLDISVPGIHKEQLFDLLKSLHGKDIIENVQYLGMNKAEAGNNAQFNSLFFFKNFNVKVQVDFELVDYDSATGKQTEWSAFSHSSTWSDTVTGFDAKLKGGVAHKYLIINMVRALSARVDIVLLQKSSKLPSDPSENSIMKVAKASEGRLSMFAFSVDRGMRIKYEQQFYPDGAPIILDGKYVFKEIPTDGSNYLKNLTEIFELLFKAKPDAGEVAMLSSFYGALQLMKKYNTPVKVISLMTEILIKESLWGRGAQVLGPSGAEEDFKIKVAIINEIARVFPSTKNILKENEDLINTYNTSTKFNRNE